VQGADGSVRLLAGVKEAATKVNRAGDHVTGDLTVAGKVGVGTTSPQAKLQVSAGAIMPAVGNSVNAGIQFPANPGGGGGDEAFIRYFAEAGENTKLLIGCQNDADDRIGLFQGGAERLTIHNGNVGLGTQNPAYRLTVNGDISLPNGQTLRGEGRLHIHSLERLYLLPKNEVHISKAWGGSGDLIVEGRAQVAGPIVPAVGNSANAGIQFPSNPGGGAGDEAFIRYFAEAGESTKLLIGCQNDADDRIGLYEAGGERLTIFNGNVGIGTQSPGHRLTVAGDISMAAQGTLRGDGRLHIQSQERLYLLPQAEVYVSQAWGGTGDLIVEGALGINGYQPAQKPNNIIGGVVCWDLFAHGGVYAGQVENGTLKVKAHIRNDGQKSFVLDHPLQPETHDLVHVCLEGPEAGVYYRGEAQLIDGEAEVELPGYFDALTETGSATVQLTPKLDGPVCAGPLAASGVRDGTFKVRGIDDARPDQAFFWQVTAVRMVDEDLEIEPRKVNAHPVAMAAGAIREETA
jgi:hypothetical protein